MAMVVGPALRRIASRAVLGSLAALVAVPTAQADVVRIKIKALTFSPLEATARPGDSVQWVNSDIVDHTATARDGSWEIVIAAGKTASLSIGSMGPIEYYCRYHPNMTGRIVSKP